MRRASGPCGTRRPAHVPHKASSDLPSSTTIFRAGTVNDFFAALRRGPTGEHSSSILSALLRLSPSGLPPGTFRAPCGRAWASGPGSCAPDGSSAFRSRPRRIPKRRTTGTDPGYVWRGSWQHTPAVVPLRFFRAFPRRGNRSTRTPCPTPVPCSRGLS